MLLIVLFPLVTGASTVSGDLFPPLWLVQSIITNQFNHTPANISQAFNYLNPTKSAAAGCHSWLTLRVSFFISQAWLESSDSRKRLLLDKIFWIFNYILVIHVIRRWLCWAMVLLSVWGRRVFLILILTHTSTVLWYSRWWWRALTLIINGFRGWNALLKIKNKINLKYFTSTLYFCPYMRMIITS